MSPRSTSQVDAPIALYFGAGQFGWYHAPAGGSLRSHGVVICPPIGYELILSHRALRHLAQRLARDGFPVIRFDYRGTGDSAGDEPPHELEPWVEGVLAAGDELQALSGVRSVVPVGLRVGGTLALLAAARRWFPGLVLWEPCLSGRNYVREMLMLSMAGDDGPETAGGDGGLSAAGFDLPHQTTEEIRRIDARNMELVGRPSILLLSRDDLPDAEGMASRFLPERWQVDRQSPVGYAGMMAEPHYNEVPEATIETIAAWLDALKPGVDESQSLPAAPAPRRVARDALGLGGATPIIERPITAGPDRLFGILTEPEAHPTEDLPLILLLNAGSVHRIGPHRVYVDLARTLARRGFRSCRMDVTGIGDSAHTQGNRENDPYASSVVPCVEVFMAALRERLGIARFIPIGLCSGAYVAFHVAQVSDHVPHAIVINPLTFYWREGMSLEVPPARHHAAVSHYRRAVRRFDTWRKLVAGKVQVRRVLRHWFGRTVSMGQARAVWLLEALTGKRLAGDNLALDLQGFGGRNVFVQFVFATGDPGYELLTGEAGPVLRRLRRRGLLGLREFDGADHTFTDGDQRRQVIEFLAHHLETRYHVGRASDQSVSVVRADEPDWPVAEGALENSGISLPLSWHQAWHGDSRRGQSGVVLVRAGEQVRGGLTFEIGVLRSLPRHRELRVHRLGDQPRDVLRVAVDALMKSAADRNSVLLVSVQVFDRDPLARRKIASVLRASGFVPSVARRSYSHTIAIDLTGADDDQLLSRLRPSARRHIRRSQRRGLVVRVLTDPAVGSAVSRIYDDTMRRGGRGPVPIDWARVLRESALHPEWSRISGAFHRDDPSVLVAFAWTTRNADAVTYEAAGSARDLTLKLPLAYSLVLDGMQWGRDTGALWYDFGGALAADSRTDSSHALQRIEEFKRHFSSNIIEVAEEWEWSPRPGRERVSRSIRRLAAWVLRR